LQGGGAGSYLGSRRFSGFNFRPIKEISQSFVKLTEHARNGKDNAKKPKHVSPPFLFRICLRFDSSLFAVSNFNDSLETIRTKGMKDQLWAIFLASVVAFLVAWRGFAVSRRTRS